MTPDELVPLASPALCQFEADETEGRSWEKTLGVDGNDGLPIDLSGCSAVCKVLDKVDGSVLVTMTTTCGDGYIKVTASPSDTTGTGGQGASPRFARWYCKVTTATGRQFDAWGQESVIRIFQGA